MSGKAQKRLLKEVKRISEDEDGAMCYSVGPKGDDIMKWEGLLIGPEGTPYENGHFAITIDFPAEYPFKYPDIRITTKIYHCNVDDNGSICLPILKTENWSPSTSMPDLMMQLVQLLREPNPSDPLRAEIAAELTSHKDTHDKKATEWTTKFAME